MRTPNRILAPLLGLALLMIACEKTAPPPDVLIEAIVMRDAAAVRTQLDAGADPNAADANGITPLMAASTSGQAEMVRTLIAAGADVNGRALEERTPLIAAIMTKQTEIALLLLEQDGIDLEAREMNGSTALVEAIALDEIDVATALLERGADINAAGPVGRTALHIIARRLDPESIEWLLQRGADAATADDEGMTTLHHAASFMGAEEDEDGAAFRSTLLRIIELQGDIDAQAASGHAPLHIAVLWGDPWVIDALLDAGADPLAMNAAGYSPVCFVTATDARPRSREASIAIVERFRQAGLTDDTAIDTKGTPLATIEGWLRERS